MITCSNPSYVWVITNHPRAHAPTSRIGQIKPQLEQVAPQRQNIPPRPNTPRVGPHSAAPG